MAKGLTERQRETWRAFLAVSTMLNHRVEQQLKDSAGLSHSQYEVLARLSMAPGGELRMTELAGVTVTSKSGLNYQVSQLEKAGLVSRRPCDSDDRGVIAALTEQGVAKLEATAPAHVELVRKLFVDSLDADQFAAMAEGIEALAIRLGTVR